MIDLKNMKKRCIKCKEHQASYNLPNESIGKYCKKCSTDEMVDVKRPLQEYCKKCVEEFGIENRKKWIRASYSKNYGDKPIYCKNHAINGMIDVISRLCKYDGCTKQPTYNYSEYKYGIYCYNHKLDGMTNVSGKKCISDFCHHIPYYHNRFKYKGYCVYCFVNLFPDEPISRNHKTKERYIINHIEQNFSNYDISCDKKIQDGCSKRRPDCLFDFGNFCLIIEIDENQHQTYDTSCENKRIMEISKDIGHRPLTMIRFNPDKYINKDGKKVSSCFGINQLGLCKVRNEKELQTRLDILYQTIQNCIITSPKKTINIIPLFMDGF
jgi:hypothetical protein